MPTPKERVIRTFCFHDWEKWSEPQTMTWVVGDHEAGEVYTKTEGYMSQRRACKKCGKVKYRKCT